MHKDVARAQAKADGIPFDPNVPVFARRMTHKDGRPGGRVAGEFTHWLSNDLRREWIKSAHKTKFYANVSVQSLVSVYDYLRDANERAIEDADNGEPPTMEALRNRIELEQQYKRSRGRMKTAMIGTQYTPLDFPDYAVPMILADVDAKLRRKHEPATGPDRPGTALAARVVLQIDTRKKTTGTNDTKPRKKGGNKRGSKRGK